MKWGVCILLLLSIFVAACINQEVPQNTTIIEYIASPRENVTAEVQSSPIDVCLNIYGTKEQNQCYYDAALENKNASYCDANTNIMQKISCYQQVAKLLNNQNVCIKILMDDKRDECYYVIALAKQDLILCGSIVFDYMRTACFDNINLTGKDPAKCKEMWTTELKAECRERIEEAN